MKWCTEVCFKTPGNPELSRRNKCAMTLGQFHLFIIIADHRGWSKEERKAGWGGWRKTWNVRAPTVDRGECEQGGEEQEGQACTPVVCLGPAALHIPE